jgi:ABC-2 type transport system ATP-binding protein
LIIETDKLTKIYGKKVGCSDITVNVPEGDVFGLLGPNGAGKSTFIKMMTGLIFPTSGKAAVLGKPLGDVGVRKKIGYLPEIFKYQEWMTGVDLLSFHASLYKMDKKETRKRIEEVLELVNLKGHEKYKVGTYSKGMQQRLGFASAMLTSPDLLFLDEPTSALDPIGRKEVRDIIMMLKNQGKTVLLNSHLLSEVEMVCDSLAIINKGSLVKQGKLEDILESKLILYIEADDISDEILSKLKGIDPILLYDNNKLTLNIKDREDINEAGRIIIQNGGKLYRLEAKKENLENMFIKMIKGEVS